MANKDISKTIKAKGPKMLPMVTLSNGKTYFIDERLRQLRNIFNPHDYIDEYESNIQLKDLEEVHRQSDNFTKFITINCAVCGKTLYNGTEKDAKRLIIYCTDC
jgi:hypothetical protein